MATMKLEIATPERLLLTEVVESVVLPCVDGYMGVLPGHAPLLARLDVGEISFKFGGGQERFLAVSGGIVEVLRDRVEVLAETSEFADEIDLDRAERKKSEAELQMKNGKPHDFQRAEVSLKKAMSRIKIRRQRVG